jgi:hypothetical protein
MRNKKWRNGFLLKINYSSILELRVIAYILVLAAMLSDTFYYEYISFCLES